MNYHKKGMWFPIALIALVAVIALWFPVRYGNAFFLNYLLIHKGVKENAQVVKKGIVVNGELKWFVQTQPSDNHQFLVKLSNSDITESLCGLSVSKSLYRITPVGASIPVTFLQGRPQECKLSSSIQGTRSILIAGHVLSAFMLLFVFGAVFFLYRSHKKPEPGALSGLTTDMKLKGEVHCPKCNEHMAEGYLPMGFGIHWRNIDQPIGLPTIFGALPGTLFLFKRPKLHAYHCTRCKIVIFQYNKGTRARKSSF